MSTTVTYKNETLATVSNNTKTLKTAGKYMEGDVVLTDVSASAPNVWQDQDGYVHLDDEGSSPIIIEPLSVTQNGTYTATTGHAYSPITVNVSGGGGSSASKKQINFIDYDGTVVESYTKTEWQSVSVLPSNPSHTGLVSQGWNWTKAQIDAQLISAPNEAIHVRQMYITSTGDTEIDVEMQDGRLAPILTIAVNGTITVDWGDNTIPNTVTGDSLATRQAVSHIYDYAGSYTIKIHVSSGSCSFYGSSSYTILRKNTTSNSNKVYTNCVRAVRIGNGINIGDYAFYACYSLTNITIPSSITNIGDYAFYACYSLANITIPSNVTSIGINTFYACHSITNITIPSGITSIGDYAFSNCHSLANITIPNSVTSIGSSAFSGCYSLTNIIIPNGVTSIGSSTFSSCYSLTNITIPSNVTNIGSSAFSSCYSLTNITIPSNVTNIGSSAFSGGYGIAEYHIKPTTIPILGATAFNYIQSDCIIYVPSAKLTDYQTASNWSTYASYMQGE